MATYRLVTGAGDELEQFHAPADADATARGREMAQATSRPGGRHSPDFRVERMDAGGWALVHAWMPVPPAAPF